MDTNFTILFMRIQACILRGILSLLFLWLTFVSMAQNPSWEWAKTFGTNAREVARQVVVDPNTQHVYVVGDWEDDLSATFPGGANPSTQLTATYGLMDGFVAKYDQDGNLVWAFKVGGPEDDQVNAIAIDESGNIYITGYFGTGTAYFSGTSPHTAPSTLTNASYEDFFLAKYNPDGEFQWVRRSTSNGSYLKGLALTTSSTALYATGIYDTGFATFGSLMIGWNPNMDDFFVIKYNLDGDEQWLLECGSNNNDEVKGVVADESGVYLAGTFYGSNLALRHAGAATALTINNADIGTGEIMIARYDTGGNFLWGQSVSGPGRDEAFDITMDADSLYITGAVENNASFPGYAVNPVPTSAQQDIFLASLAKTDGTTGWVNVIPCTDPGDERGRCMDMDAAGNLYVIGDYKSDLQFPDGVTLSSIGQEDVFVATYTANGDFRWAESAGSSGLDNGNGLAVGPEGAIYIAGRHDEQMTLGSHTLPNNPARNGYLAKLSDTLPPPSNDYPCSALLLPAGDTCASQIHNNLGATDSGIPDPGCGAYAGGDVWFKAVVPPSGNLFVGTHTSNDTSYYQPVDGYMWSVAMALYTGDCGTLIQQSCFESNSAYNSRASSAFLSDQVPGDTIWIRVWEANAVHNGMFSICSYDPGHFPGWDLANQICEENGPIDLDTTLSALKIGFADVVVDAIGIPDPGNALGAPDGNGATLDDVGDRIILDLTDTIPAGETYLLNMRSNPLISGENRFIFRTSVDNLSYQDHSFQPETSADVYDSYFITAEHPTRYLWIENNGGGGGFHFDGAEYQFRGTRGGTWSGPGVTGSTFDPAGLQGSVSIMYSVGGTSTRTDSILTTLILKSDAGILGNDTTVCSENHNLQLDLQGYSGSVISWQSSTDGFISSTSIADPNPFLPVSGLTETAFFRAIVQDDSCDPDTSNVVTVTVVETPIADPGPYGDVCGSNLGLQAIPSTGTGDWSMVSGPGLATFTPNKNDPSVSVQVDQYGAYTFAWTETNGICSNDSIFTVEFFEQTMANAGAGGDTCSLNFSLNATPSAGLGQWSMLNGPGTVTFLPSDTIPDALASVSQAGTYTFQWAETNGICSSVSTVSVIFLDMPVSHAGTGGEICGSDFQLSATPSNGTGIWTMTGGPGTVSFAPSSDSPDAIVSVDLPGMYQFTWTESNGMCVDQDSVEVNFIENLVLEAGPDLTVCGLRHDLNVTPQDIPGRWISSNGPGSASFSPSETDPMARVTVDATGVYMFKWEASQGFCSGEDSVRISFSRQATANAGPDQVLEYKFTTYLEAMPLSADVAEVNTSSTWSLVSGSGLIANPNDPATQVSGLGLGENVFQWTISSDFCPSVSDQVMITVNDVETYTIITPNNDGLNDVLVFPGIEDLSGCEIIIYNRWGMEVYRNEDYQNNWDGRDHNDRSLIADTYYYILLIPPDRIIKSFVEIRKSQ